MIDTPQSLADHAARALARAAREGQALPMPQLAQRLGVTDRHLRRVFLERHGVTPLAYLSTQRLLFAKHLLTDTSLPVSQVGLITGFGSLRRFNEAFAAQYRLSPTELRGNRATRALAGVRASDGLTLRLAYRPPYDVDGVLRFFERRALPGVESVDRAQRTLRRTLRVHHAAKDHAGWIELHFDTDRYEVKLRVASTLVAVLGRVVERTRRALDLHADPSAIADALAALPTPITPGLRVPGSFDPWESLVRIVLGQQVTVAAARTLAHRLVECLPCPVSTPWADMHRSFPSPAQVALADPGVLGSLGIVRARVAAMQALARGVIEGRIDLEGNQPLAPTLDRLREVPGVGEWTAQLTALRVLGWPDAFPSSDIGVLRALGVDKPAEALKLSQAWRPWRSYAVIELWQSLETGT